MPEKGYSSTEVDMIVRAYTYLNKSIGTLRRAKPGSEKFSESYFIADGALVYLRKLDSGLKRRLEISKLEKELTEVLGESIGGGGTISSN